MWLYIIEHEVDPLAAKQALTERYQEKDEQWGWVLVALVLDEVSEERAFKAILTNSRDNTLLAQQLTEVYFYLGKRYQLEGDYANAISLYKLALSFNVYEYVEHRYSFLELARIFDTVKAQAKQKQLEEETASNWLLLWISISPALLTVSGTFLFNLN